MRDTIERLRAVQGSERSRLVVSHLIGDVWFLVCACSAVHIITICRVTLPPELVLCRQSCVCKAYDSGVVLSAEDLHFSELVLVVKLGDQMFSLHERQVT